MTFSQNLCDSIQNGSFLSRRTETGDQLGNLGTFCTHSNILKTMYFHLLLTVRLCFLEWNCFQLSYVILAHNVCFLIFKMLQVHTVYLLWFSKYSSLFPRDYDKTNSTGKIERSTTKEIMHQSGKTHQDFIIRTFSVSQLPSSQPPSCTVLTLLSTGDPQKWTCWTVLCF